MIKIVRQDAYHQYDKDGNAITTWDNIKCAWIVESKYENEEIDWWGRDNDFPRGLTLKEFKEQNPNWDKMPMIVVTWTWNEESYKKAFPNYKNYPIPSFPTTCVRDWGYINFSKEEAIERLGRYADFHKYADNVQITYDGEEIFNGKII